MHKIKVCLNFVPILCQQMHKIKASRNFVLINEEIKTFYGYKNMYFTSLRLKKK